MKSGALAALLSLLMTLSIGQAQANFLDGEITLDDGRRTVRITVDNGEIMSDRRMQMRLLRLERAVRDLQDTVYQLQNTQPSEVKFVCFAVTCRKRNSIHASSAHNCDFFNVYKPESVEVWASSGSNAQKIARAELEADTDVVDVRGKVNCEFR